MQLIRTFHDSGMSLTSMLRDPDAKHIRTWFRERFPHPGFRERREIIVCPRQQSGPYSGELGIALDYLIRFNLERTNKRTCSSDGAWVAEYGYEVIMRAIEFRKGKWFRIGANGEKRVRSEHFREFMLTEFQKAKTNHKKFVKDGILTEALVRSSVFLAKLEIRWRSGIVDANIDSIEKDKIEELKDLYGIVPWESLKANQRCVLNPTFGKGSELIGGADADLVIDDMLVDIKSSKKFKLERYALNQIIGYYLLSIIGGINGKKLPRIKHVGIYFARFGYLFQFPVSHYYDSKRFRLLAAEFSKLVKRWARH
jgi:hypothetical protein